MHNQFRLAHAALYHDIGFKEIDPEVLKKKRVDLSLKETKMLLNGMQDVAIKY